VNILLAGFFSRPY